MTNEKIIASLIKADFCIEKAYWQIKNIPQDYALSAGITDRQIKQLLRHIQTVDTEIIDLLNKLNRQNNERNNV